MKTTVAFASLLTVLLTGNAFADDSRTVELPAGAIEIDLDRSNFEAIISDGETRVRLDSAYLPDVVETYGDSALLFMATGGNACAGFFSWVTLDEEGLRATEPFGTCAGGGPIEMTDEGPMLVLAAGGGDEMGYVFDGAAVREVQLGLKEAGVSDPTDAAAWADKPAYEVLTSAEMEPFLLEIMSWEDLKTVRFSSAVASEGMTPDGDWYAATGCRPHACNMETAGVAVSTKDGRVIAAHWEEGEGEIFGEPDSALPNKFRTILKGQF
ncbi:hypothetical protein [Martelella mangrovi]|uniref:Uncharacterized protein n=1 Tax=Martelella mangrovi TaxID=1397477 RepID=A0ABV2IBG7_9HYPH